MSSLPSYSHYIDDVIGAWCHDTDPAIDRQNFLAFQESMNSFGTLTWEFMPLWKEIAFLDLTLHVMPQGIQSWLFEKPLNLYLYIPPHSTHAPEILCRLSIWHDGAHLLPHQSLARQTIRTAKPSHSSQVLPCCRVSVVYSYPWPSFFIGR
jgi:hypothetical protein